MIVALLYVSAGVAMLWMVGRAYRQIRAGRTWPTVPGTIVERGVRERAGMRVRRHFFPRVKYEYSVGGTAYAGERIHLPWEQGHAAEAEARRIVDALPTTIDVHVDPRDPKSAYLMLATASWPFWVLLAMGTLSLVIGSTSLLAQVSP